MPNTSSHFISPQDLSTLDGITGVTLNGGTALDQSGFSVASAGDVNGDGFDDVVIGAPYASPGGLSDAGSTYLIFGHTGTWGMPLALGSLNGTNGVVINGIAAYDRSGISVASAGDVNGDGINDMVIGAFAAFSRRGSSYLIFGHRGAWNSPLVLGNLNGTNGIVINGIAAGDYSGNSVASAGDMNGDGINDVVIGAYWASPGGLTYAGSTYLIFGHTGAWNSPLALGSLNGANGVVINGISVWAQLGTAVASAGDVNGDGVSDMVIGAYSALQGSPPVTYLIFGHTGAWSSQLSLSSLNGTNGVVINRIAANDQSSIVASAGDVNGDGVSDMVLGAFGASPGGLTLAGSTYLIFGHTGAWDSPLALLNLNGTNGVVINGIAAGDYSGFSVASAGDVNGDGIDDLVIGARNATPGGLSYAGSTYLILGHRGTWSSPLALSSLNGANGVVINGIAAGDNSGFSVASAGDVNGDGLNDMLIGASSAFPGGLSNSGSTYLIFGDSLDLLINTLTINQGETIFLNNSMLAASHPNNLALNANIHFSITNVVHGAFSTPNFLQSELSQQLVSFTHDGSIYAPSYEVTIGGGWAITGSKAATISFDVPPALYVNSFSVGQGQTIVLTSQAIRASSVYYPSDALMFSVSNVLHGNFVKTNTTTIENQFNQSVLTRGQIAFATDGSGTAPSYYISVSDGRITTSAISGIVNFNTVPTLLNNQLTLTPGQQKVILSSNDLSASDPAFPLGAGGLIFTPSTLNCHFENLNLPGTTLPLFLQGNVQGGQILFVWDGHSLPAYNMSVSDGVLQTAPQAALVRLNTPVVSAFITPAANSNTVQNAIIGGTVSGLIGLGFLVFKYFLSKRMNGALKNILVVEGSTVEQEQEEWKRETLLPVVKEVFNHFKTTGFIGYRNEVNTKSYVQGVELILLEIQKHGVEVHFPKLSVTERIRLLTAIVDEIKIQLVSADAASSSIRSAFTSAKLKGAASSLIRPAFTPAELKGAAVAIAKVVAMTVNKEKVADKIRHSVVERPKMEPGSYPVMVRDNEIELESVGEQKFASDVPNQELGDQSLFESRFAAIEGHFAKSEERFAKIEEHTAKSEVRFAKFESSLEELLGRQPAAIREKPKMSLVT